MISDLCRTDAVGNGTTNEYEFDFKIWNEEDLLVKTSVDGEEYTLVLETDYTVEISTTGDGGTIAFVDNNQVWLDVDGFLDDDVALTMLSNIDDDQAIDIANQGSYYPEIIERAFDIKTRQIQQLKDQVSRSLKTPVTEDASLELPTAEERASQILGFDADGDPIAVSAVVDTAITTAFTETLLDDTTAAQARATLGFSGAGGTVTHTNLLPTILNDMTETAPLLADSLPFADASDSGNFKKATIGAIKNKIWRSVTSSGNTTAADESIVCSGASFTLGLHASPVVGKRLRIKHGGTSLTQVYTIDPDSTALIGVATTVALYSAGESIEVEWNGTSWDIISHFIPSGWETVTVTGAWSANTTYTAKMQRIGCNMNLDVLVAVTGAPTSASLTITLPGSQTIDTAQMSVATTLVTPINGSVLIFDAAPEKYDGIVLYSSTTALAIFKDDGDGTLSAVTQAAPMTFASGDSVQIKTFGIPITGWLG